MSRSDPRGIFGIYSFSPYSRTSGLPYGEVRVLKSSTMTLEGSLVDLIGGASKYPYASEETDIKAEMSIKASEYPDFMFELFLGHAPTLNAAETSGNVSTLTNKKGTLVAAVGLATATSKSGQTASLKAAKYVVVATDATHVDVYVLSSIDSGRGTDFTVQNDAMKITASPLVITTATAVEIPGTGVELTGGAGTIGMTAGDTATFDVRPINTKSSTVRIGSVADTFPEFGAVVVAKKRGNEELCEFDVFRCKAAGMPISLDRAAWSEADLKVKMLYDSTKDGLFDMRHISAA